MRTPEETFQAMSAELGEGLKQAFPVVTRDGKALQLLKLHPPELPDPHDYNAQKAAIMAGETWGTPLKATVALLGPDGKQVDKRDMRLGTLPTPTNRHTFILNGKEYQVNHQRRLRPGIYTKFSRLGEALADFNLAQGRNFSVGLDPEENRFFMRYGNTHVPLLPVLQHLYEQKSVGLGKAFDHPVTPDEATSALKTLHTMVLPNAPVPDNMGALKTALKEKLGLASLDPDVTGITVGNRHQTVSGRALQDAARQVLAVHKRDALPSTKEQLAFTEVHGVEDFLKEKFVKGRTQLKYRLTPALATKTELAKINVKGAVDGLIKEFFIGSAQSNVVQQINPLEMKENAFKLTSLGEGAIGDTHAISPEVRVIHPSSMGFIDPVRTPDNAKAGVDVRFAVNTKKIGKQIFTKVKDLQTGQYVMKSPVELYDAVVAPDREPDANGLVRAVHRGALVDVPAKQVRYQLPADDSFTVSTTLVPFLQNTHAHRAAMGAKMLGQAVSLLDREAPLVTTPHAETGIGDFLIKAPVAGTITKIENGVLTLTDAKNHIHRISYPHEFPLNGHSFLHAELKVKVGDRVAAGQLLADNNFSRNGQVALGKNLTVAYMPYKGLNHEDAVVMTRQGADKLISQHLHTFEALKDDRAVHSKKAYQAHYPGEYELKHFDKLDDDGVVKVGQVLAHGDPIVLGLRKRLMSPEQLLLGKANKGVLNPMIDTTQAWDRPYPGKVSAVQKTSQGIKVTITANAPMQVGDKVCGRHGNKGVVSVIIPNEEAPRTADGKVPDLILNSAGLTSRMNNGQLYEVIAAKAIQKLGLSQQTFPHFAGVNTYNLVKSLRDKAQVSETDELFDPKTGRSLGPTLMGPMYVLKLFKQAETGFSARAGGEYDIDLRPAKGGEEGAKSVGTLDFFSLLSHGSRKLLADAHLKSEFNPEVMEAMWKGQPLPPPKPTFAWNKFQGMLTGMGLNVKKTGNQLALLPLHDHEVLAMSNGRVTEPLTVFDKPDPVTNLPFRPEPGGLFDPTVTGGLVGNRWSHISLHEPVLNPIFKNAARTILGLPKAQFEQTLYEKGAGHLQQQLSLIDPAKRLAELQAELAKTNSTSKRDTLYKQIKYLRPLADNKLKPDTAYVLNHIPVLPPAMRPIYPDPQTGRMVVSDANQLYKNLLLVNQQLRTHSALGDAATTTALRQGLHEAVAAVQGFDGTPEKLGFNQEPPPSGFLKVITGTAQAKDGFFQSKLLSRRQDVAARGVVVPDTSLEIDEVGLPKPMAMKLYRHHGVGELVQSGMPLLKAAEEFENETPTAVKAVQAAMAKFPAILTRAPSLHKFNLMGFTPKLVDGKSIRVNTLVLKGFNMDFDGDCVLGTCIVARRARPEDFPNVKQSGTMIPGGQIMPVCDLPVSLEGTWLYEVVDLAEFPRLVDTRRVKDNGNEFFDVPSGINVFAYDPQDGTIKPFPVTEYSIHHNLQMVKVTTRSGRWVECSDDHSLYAIDPETLGLDKVKPHDAMGWLIPRPRRIHVEPLFTQLPLGAVHNKDANRHTLATWLDLDAEAGYFLGVMVGDGYAARDGGRLGLCNVSQPVFDRVKTFLLDRVCPGLTFAEHDNPHDFDGHASFSRKLHWASTALNEFVAVQTGQGAENKHLPPLWLKTPESFRWGLLAGLLDTDGAVNCNPTRGGQKLNWVVRYDTKSEKLCQEVMLLANTLGIRTGVTPYTNKRGDLFYAITLSVSDVREHAGNLTLSVPKKVETLRAMVAADPSNHSSQDAVPVPPPLADAMRRRLGRPRKVESAHASLYALLHKAAKIKTLNRSTAKTLIDRLGAAWMEEQPFGQRWMEIVYNADTLWDEVVRVEDGETGVTAYDLTVPNTWTFMMANGLVVQDTSTIHVPISPEGAADARRMMPSNNLFSPLNNGPVHVPSQETVYGLWKATVAKGAPVQRFPNKGAALAAFQAGRIRITDPIEIG